MKSQFKDSVKGLAVAALSVVFLTQCSSVERSADTSPTTESRDSEKTTADSDSSRSAEQWLNQAGSARSESARQQALIEAALAFQQQQQWQQSAAIIALLDGDSPLLQLARGQWHYHQQQWQQTIDGLEPALASLNDRNRRHQALQLVASSYARLHQYWQASLAQISAEQYNSGASAEQRTQSIWSLLRQTPADQLPSQRPVSSDAAGWWRLATATHQYQLQPEQFATRLNQWLSSYPDHLARILVEQWLARDWKAAEKIVALLPLSGRYAPQGVAVRDGLIAAAAETSITIEFIDTQKYDVAQQQQQVLASNATHLIGPLLKESVQAWLQAPLVGPYHLFLNEAEMPEHQILSQRYLQFALAPEDEARQAAERIAKKSQTAPLLFAAATPASERLVTSFQQRWQQHADQSTEVGWYSEPGEMQDVVEQQLGIRASKERIRQVKIAAGKIIIDEQERSRADIDAVYLPGNLQQVRLLKPFIDVNLSPFAPPLTVFASSATHQRSNRNGDSDLAGIQFSDSPAVLAQHPRSRYTDDWLEARPGARLSDARLFNMGYDSVYLLQQAALLNFAPGVSWPGLNGQLSVAFNRVQRQLHWAIFKANEVQPIE